MKKMLVLSAFFTALLLCSTSLFAQLESKGDTLIVGPLNSEGAPLGALNEALKGDTTATGERVHKVYKLLPNAQYILTEVIQVDFPLELVADTPTDANRPPIIRCGLTADGGTVGNWWNIFADAKFKNLWMSGINLDGTGPISWITQTLNATGLTVEYEGCILEAPYTYWAMFADWGGNNVYKITDCLFMNIGNPTGTTWNGAIFHHSRIDSVIVKNTTFFKFGAFAVNGGEGTFYTEVDHCTFVNSVVHPVGNHTHVQQKFTNNLFVNCHAFSDDDDEIKRHFDQEVKGLMNYAEIQWDPQELDSLYGPGGVFNDYDPNGDGTLTEGELVWELKNNNWFYTQPIVDYWAAWAPDVVPNPWMNNYNAAMFEHANDTEPWTWDVKVYVWADSNGNIVDPPAGFDTLMIVDSNIVTQTHEPFQFFVEENTTNLDPGIVDMNGTDVLLAQNCDNIRKSWAGEEVTDVKWHAVDDYLAFTWPIDFDLSYTNTSLQAGGTDGFAVGDLNWFPDQKEQWLLTDVKSEKSETLPTDFSLSQNYPNPFNPATVIEFSIPLKDNVTLEVFNTIGQKVGSLVNEELNAGIYRYDFDASKLSSGVYFYKLKVGSAFVQTKKMLLIK